MTKTIKIKGKDFKIGDMVEVVIQLSPRLTTYRMCYVRGFSKIKNGNTKILLYDQVYDDRLPIEDEDYEEHTILVSDITKINKLMYADDKTEKEIFMAGFNAGGKRSGN